MVGLIWFVQVVHYPLFEGVGERGFARYSQEHARLTTYVVLPLMVTELVCAVQLATQGLPGSSLGLGLVIAIWLSTFLVQTPLHGRLAGGFEYEAWSKLVTTNWFRTLAWTARGLLCLVILN